MKKAKRLDYGSTHRDVVERCRKGDRQAQFELYRLYSKAMYNICLRMVRDEMDAEDLLQNSFIDVFSKLHTFRFQSSIGAWIKRIVINNCINHLKKRRLEFQELQENTAKVPAEEMKDEDYSLSAGLVKNAMSELPDGYRIVFNLYMFEGYDHKEIGEILGISEATSKSQYSRAKRKLKDILLSQPQTSNI